MSTTHINGSDIYIVTYDFSENKIRRKIEKMLKNYGVRMQKSVFICSLQSKQADELSANAVLLCSQNKSHCRDGDSLVMIGGLKAQKIDTLLGKHCSSNEFMIY